MSSSIHCSIVLFISSDRVSVSSKDTDELLVVAIVVTKSSLPRLRQFRTRRTPPGRTKNRSRLPEFVTFVGNTARDEVLEEIVEAFDIAGRVGRKVPRPLNSLPEGGVGPALSV
jgi:hypothetical protein